jgi:acetyltransferase-like isoleucine patch superfamily enzyme
MTARIGGVFLKSYRAFTRARAKGFSLLAGRTFHSFGSNSVIEPPLRVSGERQIAIGEGVFVGANSWLQVLSGGDDVRVKIGSGTSIVGACTLSAAESIVVGERVLMARNVYIADHMHAFENPGRAVLDQGIDRIAPVEIADGAWLGQNVVVGPRGRLGRGAVVGANSVVLEDVPDRCVAVGAPARVIRRLDDEAAPTPEASGTRRGLGAVPKRS